MFEELSDKQLLVIALSVEKYKLTENYTDDIGKDIDNIQELLRKEIKDRNL